MNMKREGEGEGKVVCVTGASGYVASWLVKLLLDRGYTVRATVRNLSDPIKIEHLKALEGAEERLELFEADLLKEGSFDSAFDGCDGVFHTASPVIFLTSNPQADVIDPAVKGSLNVLRSCTKTTSIKRVVLTSSTVAVVNNGKPFGPHVVIDETWFSDPAFCEKNEDWYFLSKTLAEEAAWKFAKENCIDLVVMNPGLVIGPLLQPTLNLTSQFLLDIIIKETWARSPIITCNLPVIIPKWLGLKFDIGNSVAGEPIFPWYPYVDVRDVAHAHIMGFEKSSATGRYVLVGKSITHLQFMQLLHQIYPSIVVVDAPSSVADNPIGEVSKKKAESLGVSFMALEVSLKDCVESLKEKNFHNF